MFTPSTQPAHPSLEDSAVAEVVCANFEPHTRASPWWRCLHPAPPVWSSARSMVSTASVKHKIPLWSFDSRRRGPGDSEERFWLLLLMEEEWSFIFYIYLFFFFCPKLISMLRFVWNDAGPMILEYPATLRKRFFFFCAICCENKFWFGLTASPSQKPVLSAFVWNEVLFVMSTPLYPFLFGSFHYLSICLLIISLYSNTSMSV